MAKEFPLRQWRVATSVESVDPQVRTAVLDLLTIYWKELKTVEQTNELIDYHRDVYRALSQQIRAIKNLRFADTNFTYIDTAAKHNAIKQVLANNLRIVANCMIEVRTELYRHRGRLLAKEATTNV